MKAISKWIEELQASPIDLVTIEELAKSLRKEALDCAEQIARRDEHLETADKISALKSLP